MSRFFMVHCVDMIKELFNYWLKAVLHHSRMLMHATS